MLQSIVFVLGWLFSFGLMCVLFLLIAYNKYCASRMVDIFWNFMPHEHKGGWHDWYSKNKYFRFKKGDKLIVARGAAGYGIDARMEIIDTIQDTDGEDVYVIDLTNVVWPVEGHDKFDFVRWAFEGYLIPDNARYETKRRTTAKCNVELHCYHQ